jgi:L-lactate dehydrogenase (cytochrome)
VVQRGKPKRRLPKPGELAEVLRPRPFVRDPVDRRLARAHTVGDLRRIGRRRTPRAVFDYVDGAAESEESLRRAREAFGRVEFRPHVLRGAADTDLGVTVLGARIPLPFAFAPAGFTGMIHHEGERAVARVAERNGIPYTLSTMGNTSVADLAAAAPQARRWFQLYVMRDRGKSDELMRAAWQAGYDTLLVTVDTPVAGARLRDRRSGLTLPPTLTLRTFADGATHLSWWFNLLTTGPLEFAAVGKWRGTKAELVNMLFDPGLSLGDLERIRAGWPGKLVVKGVLNADDARDVVKAGADAVLLSSHGGRQLDRAPVPLELLPASLDAVNGAAEIWLDTGILGGGDIVAALAMGADLCLVGRAYLYGLMAGGERGVQRAVDILRDDIARTMHFLGVRSVADLKPSHAVLRRPGEGLRSGGSHQCGLHQCGFHQ